MRHTSISDTVAYYMQDDVVMDAGPEESPTATPGADETAEAVRPSWDSWGEPLR